MRSGSWPSMWKVKIVTPVAKKFPTKLLNDMRDITGLCTFNKIEERLLANLIMSDMEKKMYPSQYAKQAGVSLQHI